MIWVTVVSTGFLPFAVSSTLRMCLMPVVAVVSKVSIQKGQTPWMCAKGSCARTLKIAFIAPNLVDDRQGNCG